MGFSSFGPERTHPAAVHGPGAHRPVGDIYRPRARRAHSYKFWSCMGLDKHADSVVYAALDFRGDMTKQLDVFFNPRSSCSEGFFHGAVGALALLCPADLPVDLVQMVRPVGHR